MDGYGGLISPNGSGAPPNILNPPRSTSAEGGGAPGNVGGPNPPASVGFLEPNKSGFRSLGALAVGTLQKKITKKTLNKEWKSLN